jgi:2-methylcitrate dehydratase PrpD
VETSPAGQTLRNAEPPTVLAAKFSIPHAIAATTCLGTAGARAFTFDTLQDEGIVKLRQRVRLAAYPDLKPFPKDRAARVTMRFADGESMSAVCESSRGGADQPFDEPTLLSKLSENAAGVFPAVPDALAAVIRGEAAVLGKSWREFLAGATS